MTQPARRRPKGTGTIVQKGALYRGQKTVRGEKMSTSWVTSKIAAEKELALLGSQPRQARKRSLGYCVEKSLRQRSLKKNTEHEYLRLFYAYGGKFADRPIASITADDIDDIYDGMRHLRKQSRNQLRVNLSRAFDYAIEMGWAKGNPAKLKKLGAAPAPRPVEALTVPEARYTIKNLMALGRVFEEPLASMYVIGLLYGLRANERRGLCWDDVEIDDERPRITIRSKLVDERGVGTVWVEETKSDTSLRTIKLDEPSRELLLVRRERTREIPLWTDQDGVPRDLVWRQENGQPITTSFERRDWRRVQASNGIRRTIPPTGMRHTAATLMITPKSGGGLGMDVLTVSRILGHTDIRLVERTYAKRNESTYGAAADAYNHEFYSSQVNHLFEDM